MSIDYPIMNEAQGIGTLATPVTLTTSYADNLFFPLFSTHFSQMTYFCTYTTGAGGIGNSVQIRIEAGPTGIADSSIVLYQETSASFSGGTITHSLAEHTFIGDASATAYSFLFYAPPAYGRMRLSAKETVVGGSAGTLVVRLLKSGF